MSNRRTWQRELSRPERQRRTKTSAPTRKRNKWRRRRWRTLWLAAPRDRNNAPSLRKWKRPVRWLQAIRLIIILFSFCLFQFYVLLLIHTNQRSFWMCNKIIVLRHTLTRMAYSWADETALARLVQVIQALQSIHRTIPIIPTIVATSIGWVRTHSRLTFPCITENVNA